jgi:hypothetical protein
LESQNFEALVSMNQNELTMRHSLILEDFHKLSGVSSIYTTAPRRIPPSPATPGTKITIPSTPLWSATAKRISSAENSGNSSPA